MTSALKLLESSSVHANSRINYVHDKEQNLQFRRSATQMKGKLTYQIMIQSHDASASARI